MAELYGEFDAPLPAPKPFCNRITVGQYERQGSVATELALTELLDYLDYNPTAFFAIILKRREEEQQTGLLTFLKTKLYTWLYGQEELSNLNSKDAQEKLRTFKEDLIKSYNYGQEATGSLRRFSHRLVEKKLQKVDNNRDNTDSVTTNSMVIKSQHNQKSCVRFPIPPNAQLVGTQNNEAYHMLQTMSQPPINRNCVSLPPPPPPPPPLLPPASLPLVFKTENQHTTTSNTALHHNGKDSGNQSVLSQLDIHLQKKQMKMPYLKAAKKSPCCNDFTSIIESIKNPNTRKVLKPTQNKENECVTPEQYQKKRKVTNKRHNDNYSTFNQELIRKFKLAHGSPLENSPLSDHGFSP